MKPYYTDSQTIIYHADALDFFPTILSGTVDAIITDPPYGTSDFAKSRGHGRERLGGRSNHVDVGWDQESAAWDVFDAHMREAERILDEGGNLFQFCGIEQAAKYMSSSPNGLYYKAWGAWHKKNPIPINMNIRLLNSLEMWTHHVNGAKTGTFNNGGKPVHNFVESGLTPGLEKRHGKHPTQKPLSLMSWAVSLFTDKEDLILDPFMGSGSTLVAAKSLGRHSIGVEVREEYCEIAAKRLAEGHSLRSIAEAIGTSHGNLSNWLKADKLSAERVIAISYELGIDPVKSLAETGHLREVPADEEVSKEELLERIQKLTEQLRLEIEEESNVISLDSRRNTDQSDSMFENMVADSSPDEDELRNGDEYSD